MDKEYAAILRQCGYIADCTVTPGIDWRSNRGQTEGSRGIDYRRFFHKPYEMSLEDISKKGKSGMLEVPVTVRRKSWKFIARNYNPWIKRDWNEWLRPNGSNLKTMKEIVAEGLRGGNDYVEFMLHSSELMPGGSPTFQNEKQIEKLYGDLEELFEYASHNYWGIGLTDYALRHLNR